MHASRHDTRGREAGERETIGQDMDAQEGAAPGVRGEGGAKGGQAECDAARTDVAEEGLWSRSSRDDAAHAFCDVLRLRAETRLANGDPRVHRHCRSEQEERERGAHGAEHRAKSLEALLRCSGVAMKRHRFSDGRRGAAVQSSQRYSTVQHMVGERLPGG